LHVPEEFRDRYLDILFKHQDAISTDNMTWGWPGTTSIESISKMKIQSTENNSKSLRLITISSSRPWKNGSKKEWSGDQIPSITHRYFASQRSRGKDSRSCKTSGS
jgi:hypothetical protein